jgi:Putative zinc-finger
MDRLLRRYSRRNAEALPAAGNALNENAQDRTGGAHMDADELNAYAEGALPEAARARYFTHLADCDSCRKLVTELTLASGALVEEKRVAVTETPRSKSWREWLAAIFSPPVLRYAVPALALFGVIIVAVVMMRARREESFVAQNNEATNNTALRTQANENSDGAASSANTNTDTNHSNANSANSNIASASAQASPAPAGVITPEQEEKTPTTTPENGPLLFPPPAPLADSPNSKSAVGQTGLDEKRPGTFGENDKRGEVAAGAPVPQATPAPVLASPQPANAADSSKREEQAKAKNPAKDDDEVVVIDRTGPTATTNKTASNELRRDRSAKATEPLAASAGGRAAASPKKETRGVATESERPAETRSVGGRQFRRQGNAWVDTEYNSSRSTTNVARGSEQYRALLADEHGLRTITQQLGGEVIVVWKNRAYRFY